MKTCKECEYYEFYDGPVKPFMGDKAAMKCTSGERQKRLTKQNGSYRGTYDEDLQQVSLCKNFTPKKPEEEEERVCRTCKNSMLNNEDGKSCNSRCDGKRLWQSIPKPGQATISPEEKNPCGKYCLILDATFRDGGPVVWCDKFKKFKPATDKACRSKTNPKTITEPPKQKENKMNRTKKWIRRYVMGCTMYCTGVICVVLNPSICRLWNWIMPPFHKELDVYANTAYNWLFTILSIAIILTAIYAFNKATAFVFGKLEK